MAISREGHTQTNQPPKGLCPSAPGSELGFSVLPQPAESAFVQHRARRQRRRGRDWGRPSRDPPPTPISEPRGAAWLVPGPSLGAELAETFCGMRLPLAEADEGFH